MSRASYTRITIFGVDSGDRMRVYLLTGLLIGVATAATRDVISFDFGWKHRAGLHAWAGPDDQPPENPDPGMNPAEACKFMRMLC